MSFLGDKKRQASYGSDSDTAVDEDESYVQTTLAKEKPLPPITWQNWYKEINVISTLALTVVPMIAIYGCFTTKLTWQTALWSLAYYQWTGLGITAGYHRLWAHRSYNASKPLQYFLAFGGSGAVEGSIRWWARGHRAHHRYTDTDLDPYSAHKGLLYSHLLWMIVKPRRKPGVADVSDLSRNEVVLFQHRYYVPMLVFMGFVFPTLVAGFGWGDWRGGYFYAGAFRLLVVHHSTFCVNSIAHYLGEAPFDDKHTPRDHVITALLTNGEGYHNFHHQYPSDYRNAIKWHQYDPTKWFIWSMKQLGLASELKTFSSNSIAAGQYHMKLKELAAEKSKIVWPRNSDDLPVLDWDEFQDQHKNSGRKLIAVGGYIHDVGSFMKEHPGGYAIIRHRLGKDATVAFNGGTYLHSNAAHNLLAMYRVGVLRNGGRVEALLRDPPKGLGIQAETPFVHVIPEHMTGNIQHLEINKTDDLAPLVPATA
ncbi:uncharacterized protein L969DRAFT_83942 [Mixia osmundae IAM 14324]|nr:uncharacterized protein L969DRAFT_83942 [Mixia osmundae IAM 14324]KEI42080.1 hypothetical protein L969DRAFT_83942 [Mixia osmundae IAM 14324]